MWRYRKQSPDHERLSMTNDLVSLTNKSEAERGRADGGGEQGGGRRGKGGGEEKQ